MLYKDWTGILNELTLKPNGIMEQLNQTPEKLSQLALLGLEWAEEASDVVLIEKWITCLETYITLTHGDKEKAVMLQTAGYACVVHCLCSEKHKLVKHGKDMLSEALSLLKNTGQPQGLCLHYLGTACGIQFQSSGMASNINACIDFKNQALEHLPEDHEKRAELLSSLGAGYQIRFEVFKESSDIQAAIAMHLQAIELTPADHKHRYIRVSNLAYAYLILSRVSGSLSDVQASISAFESTLKVYDPKIKPEIRLQVMIYLAMALQQKFLAARELADIERSITILTEAVGLCPQGHPGRHDIVHMLAHGHHHCFDYSHNLHDIEQSITNFQESLRLSDGAGHSFQDLTYLGDVYRHRFELLGERSDLHHAVEALEKSAWCYDSAGLFRFFSRYVLH